MKNLIPATVVFVLLCIGLIFDHTQISALKNELQKVSDSSQNPFNEVCTSTENPVLSDATQAWMKATGHTADQFAGITCYKQ